ncbi:hypothetical protein SAMD00019534_110610 [Acytostelium subglobosum LB1]|uniref:hypothetical protein n=1 Tax=Acytostelium subglobosum LB1 TaxID=1410327 RepID=UPI000644EB9A|nr:hypothetical protein SAMD00019534_110610 [Acytostelium subglobosum LB1]GAM27885.1 hypothetical protein SAMD00019534_110610 [Acytostelium subglobosum LB1]|eukprot:XP_012749168.1 hypothetical protein SAMD00019534_110610 [Acytostelium subglobosum LB1]
MIHRDDSSSSSSTSSSTIKQHIALKEEIGKLENGLQHILRELQSLRQHVGDMEQQHRHQQQHKPQQQSYISPNTQSPRPLSMILSNGDSTCSSAASSSSSSANNFSLSGLRLSNSHSLNEIDFAVHKRKSMPRLHIPNSYNSSSSSPTMVKRWIEETIKSPNVSTLTTQSTNTASLATTSSKKIKLDVGGKIFATTVSTLTKHPDSMLAAMFSSRFELPTDDDGRIFIDRDGKLFGHILAYLRDGPLWVPPGNQELRKRLEIEFSYYGLTGPLAPLGLSSPMITPRCVCDVKNFTLGQEAHHQGHWEEIKDFSGGIKSFRLLCALDSRIYAITERQSPSSSATQFQFEEYNPVYNSWTVKCPILDTMTSYYLVSAVIGDCIYAIPDAGLKQPIFCYERSEARWKMTDSQLPTGKTSFSLAVIDEYLYVIGGYQGSTATDIVDRYHPRTNSWCQVAPMNTKRSEFASVVLDDMIYVIGGGMPGASTAERYNPHSNTWSLISNPNSRCAISTGAVLDGRIYTIGSENEYEGLNVVLQFSPSSNEWKRVAPIIYNSYYTTSVLVIDRYLFFIPWTLGVASSGVKRFETCTIYDM